MVLILAVIVALVDQVGRPMPALWPRRDLDVSWMVGLQLLRDRGLDFGPDIAFTYGPWGILTAPTGIDASDLWLAASFRCAVVALLFLHLLGGLPARRWALLVALCATLLIGNCNQAGWVLMLALSVRALALLAQSGAISQRQVAPIAALSALSIQIKSSEGLLCLAFVGLLALASRSMRVWLTAGGSFVVSFLTLWLAGGQDPRDILGWLSLSAEIVVGHGDGMANPTNAWITWLMVAGVALTTVAVLLARGFSPMAKIGALGMLLFLLKTALTRVDAPHLLPGYSGVLVVLLVAMSAGVPRLIRVSALPVLVVMAMLLTVNTPTLPPRKISAAPWQLDAMPGQRTARLAAEKRSLVADLALGADVARALGDHPVSVDPWEISAVWAYDLEWQPLPVFQAYQANTPRLDQTNAAALLADPDHRVLREAATFDARNQLWDSPRVTLALVCNFGPVASDEHWLVLARIAGRCGSEQRLSSVRVSSGQVVELPSAVDALVGVRFVPDRRPLIDRLVGLSGYQRNLLHATLDDTEYRVPEALAGGPLIVATSEPEPVLFDRESASSISFDRAGQLQIVEIPLQPRG